MSHWIIATVRGRKAKDYEFTRADHHDRWEATADIAATMDADGQVRTWTVWKGHVYAYLTVGDWEPAEEWLAEYAPMAEDAVLLMANDTTDVGAARYYPRLTGSHSHQYSETQGYDGVLVGEMALCVINSHHGIVARDPFHNTAGQLDDSYLEDGQDFGERDVCCHE